MNKLPVALQLYTVRDAAQQDFFGVLKQVKEMGYDHVEFTADFFGHTAGEIRAELDRLGLVAISAHVPIEMLTEDLEGVLRDFGTLGCRYIAIPWLNEQNRPGSPAWPAVVEQIGKIGRAMRSAGITLLYHNHDFEFVKIGGEYALDLLYSAIPADLLQAEIDTCWVKVAGEDPAQYVLKYAGRSPVVHLKDFFMADGGSFEFRPVGHGVQDMPAILDAALKAGAGYVVVEQDFSVGHTPLEAARLSREYLKSLGW